jgi:serine/threonine protein phosphatase 1
MFQWFLRSGPRQEVGELVPTVAASDRLYVIGDIHGRRDLLGAMVKKLVEDAGTQDDARKPRFIFLGDYIDRGDHSAEVLDLLSAIETEATHNFSFLMGNHEAAMLAFLEDPIDGADWLGWGGRQTLTSYGISSVSRRPDKAELIALRDALYGKLGDHLPFLKSLKKYDTSGDVICAHASLDPALELGAQPDAALLWGQPPSGQGSGMPGKRLIHGHFADFEPVVRPERICVDTGAYYSGRLTAVRLDDEETFLSVDVMELSG